MKHTKEILEKLAKESVSVREICTKLGLQKSGSANSHIKSRLTKFKIDTSHFLGRAARKGIASSNKKHWSEHLKVHPFGERLRANTLRRCLKEAGVKYQCNVCKNEGIWNQARLGLEIDHINECGWDNRLENLQFLCPNCHSQKTLGR